MTTQQMMVLFDETVTKMRNMLEKKGHDYSQEGNRLSNFLDTANNVQIDPVQGCMYMMGIKISRLANLIANKKTPNNESIEDTAIDLIVYAFLNYCLVHEIPKVIIHGKECVVDDVKIQNHVENFKKHADELREGIKKLASDTKPFEKTTLGKPNDSKLIILGYLSTLMQKRIAEYYNYMGSKEIQDERNKFIKDLQDLIISIKNNERDVN